MYIKLCKYGLGTGKRRTNTTVMSELNRFPIHFDIKSMLKYWHRQYFPALIDVYIEFERLNEIKVTFLYGSLITVKKKE